MSTPSAVFPHSLFHPPPLHRYRYGPGGEYYEGGDGAVSADDLRKQQDLRKLRGALG